MLGASLAISAISAGVAHNQQSKAASQQRAGIAQQRDLTLMGLATQQDQATEDAAEAMSEKALESQKELALVQTMAGENGAGNTAARLANAARLRGGSDQATIGKNLSRQLSEIGQDGQAATMGARTRLSSVQDASWLGTGLQIGGAALDAYGRYDTAKTNADYRRSRAAADPSKQVF